MNKNLFLFAAAAALTFTACSDNDDMTASRDGSLSSNETTAVQFSTYLAGQQSRAAAGKTGIIGATELKEGFGVFAYNTGTSTWDANKASSTPNFMYNQKVLSSDGTVWTYDPIKYWPNDFANGNVDNKQGTNGEEFPATGTTDGNKLSFFAYAPYVDAMSYESVGENGIKHTEDNDAIKTKGSDNAVSTFGITAMTFNTTKGEPYVRYELGSTDIKNEVDLLWGQKLKSTYALANGNTQNLTGDYNVDLTKQAVNEKIGFNFKHALARLGGNTTTTSTTTETDESKQHVKIVLDIDNGGYDASTAITGGDKDKATLVTVNSIKIRDIDTYLAETGAKTTTYTTTTGSLRTKGWFNIATGKWDNPVDGDVQTSESHSVKYDAVISDGKADGDKTVTKLNTTIAEPESAPSYTSSKWSMTGVTTDPVGVYATSEAGTDNGILMIPNDNAAQTLVVTVKYTVRTADDHLAKAEESENQGGTKIVQEITNAVNIPAKALASNKVYTLLIHLGLTSVKFEAQVENWADATTPDSPSDNPDNPNNNSSENNKDIYLPSNTLATSLTASAGATTSITVPAATTSFTINLTGLTDGNKVSATADPTTTVTLNPETITSEGTSKATVTLTANENATAKATKVTITEKNSSDETITTTTVTINQAAKE